MIRRLLLLPVLALSGCAILVGTPPEYKGSDAGQVVIGIGAAKGQRFNSYGFVFRRVDGPYPDDASHVSFSYLRQLSGSPQQPDYDDGRESGVALAGSLPAGRYEFFSMGASSIEGSRLETYYTKREQWFSIPFTVQVGKAVYIGNYEAIPGPTGRGVMWVVQDRFKDDVALARKHVPAQPVSTETVDATPTARAIGSPFFVDQGW